jgi:glycine hydroxymethyltransferase
MTFWGPDFAALEQQDPEIAGVVLDELTRLRGGLQLIASENFTSPAVLAALGSTLSNKYAEGYPGKRYYGGCEVVDVAEQIGIDRAKQLFGAEHANLQPHSGASANLAVYGAFLQPGDTLLAMSLPHGGHLTHGTKVSFSGKWFNAVHYGVAQGTEDIDYDQMRDLAREHRPKMIIAGGSAIPRLIDFAAFREVADEVGAVFMVDAAHFIGLVAGQAIPSPVPYADVVTVHDAQGAARPARRRLRLQGRARRQARQGRLPDDAGRAADARGRAKAVNFKECMTPEYAAYTRQVDRQRPGAHRGAGGRGHAAGHRRHGHPPGAARPAGDRGVRQGRRGPLRPGRHRAEQERHPVRPAAGLHRQRRARRHPAVTTQGMTEGDMKEVGSLIGRAVRDEDGSAAEDVRAAVTALVTRTRPTAGRSRPRCRCSRQPGDSGRQPRSQLASAPCGSTCSSCASPRPSRTC